jgi:hypothetical protein
VREALDVREALLMEGSDLRQPVNFRSAVGSWWLRLEAVGLRLAAGLGASEFTQAPADIHAVKPESTARSCVPVGYFGRLPPTHPTDQTDQPSAQGVGHQQPGSGRSPLPPPFPMLPQPTNQPSTDQPT